MSAWKLIHRSNNKLKLSIVFIAWDKSINLTFLTFLEIKNDFIFYLISSV